MSFEGSIGSGLIELFDIGLFILGVVVVYFLLFVFGYLVFNDEGWVEVDVLDFVYIG